MKRSVIIALDLGGPQQVKGFLADFAGAKLFVKVGMELFYQSGPEFVGWLKEEGHRVFLDLKLHDIPNTVKRTMKALAGLQVDLVNVHAAGGRSMMEAAMDGLSQGTTGGQAAPKCIAVTQLTSISEQVMREELLIDRALADVVKSYAALAKTSGLDGVVCSPWEVPVIKGLCGESFVTVTPGIRMAEDDKGDQIRIATPTKAWELGSDHIVVGRPITGAQDPVAAYQAVLRQWEGN